MHKIFFKTHGCSTNFAESEIMMGSLNQAGFKIVTKAEEAEIIVINVCTVKGEFTALREIRKIHENYQKKKFIIAGCISKKLIQDIREISEDASLVNTHNLSRIVEVVEELINGNIIEAVSNNNDKKTDLPKIRKNPIVGIVPILQGCNNECTYCSVKLIKGKLESYKQEEILKEVNHALEQGCKEIWITSQDNAAFGTEQIWRSHLPELLKEILAIPRDFTLRLGMMNVNNLRPIIDEMIELYKNDKMFKFIHIPLQSGNDFILNKMNRNYSYEEFKQVINKFRASIPKITFSTDVIVGFPGETEEQFASTVDAVRELCPEVLNISRFIPREGTRAFDYKNQLHDEEIKKRSRIMTDIFINLASVKNEQWLGWQGEILIDEKGKDDSWIGRNIYYKQVIVFGDYRLGQKINVLVTKTTAYDLRAEEIKNS